MFELQIMPPVRAAQYIRMSTEHQRYSLENQIAGIAEYAAMRGYNIVHTYQDAGKSGLSLRGREGLKQLLADVVTGQTDFSAILVLDISRWGRFQDTDQSAHYEFICRDAGVAVVYCGEPFENDGSMVSSILKNIKRVMAGEYSRELSAKVSRAHIQQARLGFKQGGNSPYGTRRLLVDKDGTPRFLLGYGEWKGLNTDRIVFVPGPPDELIIVRRIFKMFVSERLSMRGIALRLNEEGVPSTNGGAWNGRRVRTVLASELMIGNYVFNRSTQLMRGSKKRNPPDRWVRTHVMEPIVDANIFAKAQRELGYKRGYAYAKSQMLKNLRRLFKEKKKLTITIINACPYTACGAFYGDHFGGMKAAYAAVGYEEQWPPRRRYRNYSDEKLLEGIRRLHGAFGYVTSAMINADPALPMCRAFTARFGSMTAAYALAGFATSKSESVSAARKRASAQKSLRPERFKSSK
ncbi:MAG: recombinase family protein [Mesorhizobium sp.]|uniref:recombinase family protein n=1 Tax=Mesorhizobium sp. TaxID=1871066 RepID=UPI0011F72B99|nr:recombinase family protein [Mesorhizobium sp.]TIP74839.1 MAG: recombinase family protein [Mesorhizobium sp.]TIQ14648.1 MAG: recombinase family protein [Mesorhizobium sp.]TIR52168.1 MAG: recombinase family protein [Mesorhizobium sp.]TJV96276.1 MAG: recombinase family protein [Mesorhizobium sp.]